MCRARAPPARSEWELMSVGVRPCLSRFRAVTAALSALLMLVLCMVLGGCCLLA